MAADTWEKLEQVFESRVARVLNAMQIPTHDDVQELSARVESLTRAVEKLTGEPVKTQPRKKTAAKPRKKSRKTSARKSTSRKKTARKKTNSKKKSASAA